MDPKRINVAITPDTLEALARVIEREQVSLTEAVRRLIGYGDAMYGFAKVDGAKIIARMPDGTAQEVVIL